MCKSCARSFYLDLCKIEITFDHRWAFRKSIIQIIDHWSANRLRGNLILRLLIHPSIPLLRVLMGFACCCRCRSEKEDFDHFKVVTKLSLCKKYVCVVDVFDWTLEGQRDDERIVVDLNSWKEQQLKIGGHRNSSLSIKKPKSGWIFRRIIIHNNYRISFIVCFCFLIVHVISSGSFFHSIGDILHHTPPFILLTFWQL